MTEVKLCDAAFECGIKGVVCTTMAWLSDHEVVAGLSNGYIAAWDLRYEADGGRV